MRYFYQFLNWEIPLDNFTKGLKVKKREGFKKGFTLVEMMIVVAIIAILAGVAIPRFMGYIRKAETTEAVGLMRAIIDGQAAYAGAHDGTFYGKTDMATSLRVLNVALPTSQFNFEMQVNSDGNTTIIRAYNTENGTLTTAPTAGPFIYMFAPLESSGLISPAYDAEIWNNTVHIIDYVNDDTVNSDFNIGGTWLQ